MVDASKLKGNLFALISSLFQSSVLVFWTYLLSIYRQPVLMIYWFGAAALILTGLLFFMKNLKFDFNKRISIILILFGFFSAVTTFLLMASAKKVGASTTSLVMQTTVIFSLFYSIFSLKERLTKKEFAGILLVVIGLFVLNWKSDLIITLSSLLVVLAAFLQSTNDFLTKKLLANVPKLQLNLIRVACIFLFGLIYLLIIGENFQPINLHVFFILIAGVLLGPIFTYIFYYSALQKTSLAAANALKSASPVFTFSIAFIFLGEFLTLQQTISFIISIFGIYLILRNR